jgi:serine phosphatase RsbU (regulator of sigma subunit)
VKWIREHAGLPLEIQEESLTRELSGYRGDRPQRDDITVLAFRFESSGLTEENPT